MSNILVLNSVDLYEDFTQEYSKHNNYPNNINWDLVSKNYKGIEFPNYEQIGVRGLHQVSKEYEWTYTIDVNSGCIWDTSAIKKIRKL